MTDTSPITFQIHGLGEITMTGVGPWRVREYGPASAGIIDSTGRETPPSVRSKVRLAQNVIFAKVADSNAVVAKANEILMADQAQF